MTPFCIAFLLVRGVLEASGAVDGACVACGFVVAIWAAAAVRLRVSPALLRDVACGVLLALILPAPNPIDPPARSTFGPTRLEGVVEGTAVERDDGIRFRLQGGPNIVVEHSQAAPFPGTRIQVVGVTTSSGRTLVCKAPEAVETLELPSPLDPSVLLERLRRAIRDRIRSGVDGPTGDFLCALTLGDRSLDDDVRDDCARTGILHLIAVSGSHLGFVAAGLAFVVRAPGPLAGLLAVYAALTGFQAPVLRSLILALAGLLARASGRRMRPMPWMLLSATVVVILVPGALEDPGFQLSWCAFAALPEGGNGLRAAVVAGLRASVATLPVVVWHFSAIPLFGIPATLLLAPVIPVLLGLGFLMALFPDSPLFVPLASTATSLVLAIADAAASVPGAVMDVARPHPWAPPLLLAALAGAVFIPTPHRVRRFLWIPCVVLQFVPAGAVDGIHAIPAGRGSCALVSAGGATVLVDTGPPESDVVRELLRRGIRRLDTVVVTHADVDHSGNLDAVLRTFRPRTLVTPPSATALAPTADGVVAGDVLDVGPIRIDVIGPPRRDAPKSANESCIVAVVRVGSLVALFTGDAEDEGLRAALPGVPPFVDVLFLPHHGSRCEALPELLERTRIGVAVAAGRPRALAPETRILVEGWGIPLIRVVAGRAPPPPFAPRRERSDDLETTAPEAFRRPSENDTKAAPRRGSGLREPPGGG